LLIVNVPVPAPTFAVVTAPPKFNVVTVEFNKSNVAVFAVNAPPPIN
jgi:hypothetical protein